MSEPQKLKVHIEIGEMKVDLEGDPDTVIKELLMQLTQIYPALEIAKKLTFTPDIVKLSEVITGILEFAPEGIILNKRELSAEQAILICLLGCFISSHFGREKSDSMSALRLSKVSGKALKTISNQIALMVDEGLVEKIGKGEFHITSLGIKRAEAIAGGLK